MMYIRLLIVCVVSSLVIASVEAQNKYKTRKLQCESQPMLVCATKGTDGNTVSGNVTFTPTFKFDTTAGRRGYHVCFVQIHACILGLSPGKHGFHIHTYGDIRAANGKSTGGHFTNPDGDVIAHGYPDSPVRHWGDLGNVESNGTSYTYLNMFDKVINIHAIIGRGLTIHADDDEGPLQQPTGNAGARVATCVIGYANPDY